MTDTPVADALTAFRASGSPWLSLPFFAGGEADAVAARVDARIAAGARPASCRRRTGSSAP